MTTGLLQISRAQRRLSCLALLFFASAPAYASLVASPNPNTGSYTVEWGGVNGAFSYTVYETYEGVTTSYGFLNSTTFEKSFSGKAVGIYISSPCLLDRLEFPGLGA